MPSSGSEPDRYAALARLPGPDIVTHLRSTFSRADYDAAARVLADRDRRLAHAEAAAAGSEAGLVKLSAEVDELWGRYLALKEEQSRARCSLCGGAIGRRAGEPGPVIDLCSSDDDDDDEELEEGEFRPPGVAGVSCERKEEPASVGDEGRRAGVSCQRKKPAASAGDERSPAAGVSCERKEPAASPGDVARGAGVSCERKEPAASKGEERTPAAGVSCRRKAPASEGEEQSPAAGVSCKRKAPASEGEEQSPAAGVSCKRKVPASGSSPDDEDDKTPLSQLFMKKKQRRALPGANGQPKKGHGDVLANSAGPLGVDRPGISPVNWGIREARSRKRSFSEAASEHKVPDDDPKVAVFVQGTGNGQLGKNGGLYRTMPSPPPSGSTAWNSSRKNCSKPNGSEGQARIDEKQGPVIPPVNRGTPEAVADRVVASPDDGKVAAVSVQGTGNGQSVKNGGLSKAMPRPPLTGSTAGNSSFKKCSKLDGSEGRARISDKQGPVAGPENDAPVQVRAPRVTDTARRIVGSARVGAETPMELTGPSTDGNSMVLKCIEGQEKAIGKTKLSLETNGTGGKAMVLRDTREQQKLGDQVLNTKVLSGTDGTRGHGVKLSPCQSPVDTHGGRPTTTDKPVSATLQHKNQLALHSEQMSVESSLPSAVTRHWKSSSAILNSCLIDKELRMQAVCALHRQKKFTTQPIAGGISKFDAHRVAALAEFLLDDNLQGPLKRTAEDLEKHDSTGHDFVERVVLQCSEQLFCIFRSRGDKYFC